VRLSLEGNSLAWDVTVEWTPMSMPQSGRPDQLTRRCQFAKQPSTSLPWKERTFSNHLTLAVEYLGPFDDEVCSFLADLGRKISAVF